MPESAAPWSEEIARLDARLASQPGDLGLTLARAQLHEARARWLLERGCPGREELLAAMRDYVPPGTQFTDLLEAQQRQEAFSRCFELQQGLAPDGNPRRASTPDAAPIPEAIAEAHAVNKSECLQEAMEDAVAPAETPPLAMLLRQPAADASLPPRQFSSNLGNAFLSRNHRFNLAHADRCVQLGDEMLATEPRLARLCYEQAERNYAAYQRSHDAHLPASRWDGDCGQDLCLISQKIAALGAIAVEAESDWRTAACRGDMAMALAWFAALPVDSLPDPACLKRDYRLHAMVAWAALEMGDRAGACRHRRQAEAGWSARAPTDAEGDDAGPGLSLPVMDDCPPVPAQVNTLDRSAQT